MSEEAMDQALNAIFEITNEISHNNDLSDGIKKKLELIISISRYKIDVRSIQEKEGQNIKE
jgi:hypothetical protein